MHESGGLSHRAGGSGAAAAAPSTALASVVIAVHDQAESIARTVNHLLDGLWADEVELTVVCDGCTDDTPRRARRAAPEARVLETPRLSQAGARRIGSAACTAFPRVHVDADVVLAGPDLRRLVAPLLEGAAQAATPHRVLVTTGCPLLVRWYCEVWQHLPEVGGGLVGGGAVALTEEGQARVEASSGVTRTDTLAAEVFADDERVVVEGATVLVHAPRHLWALVGGRPGGGGGPGTSTRSLARMVARHPSLAPKVPAFLVLTGLARLLAREPARDPDLTVARS